MPNSLTSIIPTKDQLDLYRKMLLIRRFEEKAGQLYGMGLIGGFCHLYIGQEAVAVGMDYAKIDGDSAITSYRDHGIMLACDSDPEKVLGELMGRTNGCSKGKGGSMHMFDLPKKFYGGHGIVGAPIPLGTGLGFAHHYRGEKNVCLTYFGDGATNQGQVYEAFNMASLWKLPVVYIIENNRYAMGTSIERSSATTELFRRGEAFGIPGKQVNGMDVFEVVKEGKAALEHARSGKGPYILEMMTYRYRGHSMSDPAKYRSKDEVADIKEKRDPLENYLAQLLKNNVTTAEKAKAMDKDIRAKLATIADNCKAAPMPDADQLWTDIYTDSAA